MLLQSITGGVQKVHTTRYFKAKGICVGLHYSLEIAGR